MRIEKQIYEAQDVSPVVIYGKKEGQDQALPAGIENLGNRSAIFTSVESVCVFLKNIILLLANFPWVDKSLNRVRGTTLIESGTITAVTTVTNAVPIGTIDTLQGRLLIDGSQLTAWALCCRARIT